MAFFCLGLSILGRGGRIWCGKSATDRVENPRARYRISGPMDRKALDGFGFEFREFFDGVIDVDIEASGRRLEIAEAVVDLRLDDAEIGFGDI